MHEYFITFVAVPAVVVLVIVLYVWLRTSKGKGGCWWCWQGVGNFLGWVFGRGVGGVIWRAIIYLTILQIGAMIFNYPEYAPYTWIMSIRHRNDPNYSYQQKLRGYSRQKTIRSSQYLTTGSRVVYRYTDKNNKAQESLGIIKVFNSKTLVIHHAYNGKLLATWSEKLKAYTGIQTDEYGHRYIELRPITKSGRVSNLENEEVVHFEGGYMRGKTFVPVMLDKGKS